MTEATGTQNITPDLAINEIGHAVGYQAAGAVVVHIAPWKDGLITTGYPASCEAGTQLPLIAGMVATLMLDSRLAKVQKQVVTLVLKTPEALPVIISNLDGYENDVAELNVKHAKYADEVKQAVALIGNQMNTEEFTGYAEMLLKNGTLTLGVDDPDPAIMATALHEMGIMPAKGEG